MRLRERLAVHDEGTASLLGIEGERPFASLAQAVVPTSLAGRSVLLLTAGQMASAAALVALDGLARRIVLCPPDVAPIHLPALVAAAEVEAICCDARTLPATVGLGPEPIVVAPLGPPAGSAPAAPVLDTEWVLLTSGTTGVPKLVVHDLAGLVDAIPPGPAPGVWGTFYDIRRFGGLQIFFRALLGGRSLGLSAAGESVPVHLERLAAAGATHVSGTPSHWRRVLLSGAAERLQPLCVRLSGEIADQPLLDRLAARFPGARVEHAFASTEAGVAATVTDGRAGWPAALLDRAPGDPVELRLRDGTLRIRSRRTAHRYLSPGAPAVRDADGFVDTGDEMERAGDRVLFCGRRGGVINVGGQKVHPEEVEAVLAALPGVEAARVFARRSALTGALVAAEVVPSSGGGEPAGPAADTLRDEILAGCRAALPAHKVPATIRFVPALAVGPAGKLVRADG